MSKLTHSFTVSRTEFAALQTTQRHLFTKDSSKIASGDLAIINDEDVEGEPDMREQLSFDILSVEHGPGSKHVMGPYCLIGLYSPYTLA